MAKIYYSLEEQLERINEEVEEFSLRKPAEEMSEEELAEAEADASAYVEWVEDDEYVQAVPKIRKTGRLIYPL